MAKVKQQLYDKQHEERENARLGKLEADRTNWNTRHTNAINNYEQSILDKT